MTRNDVISDYFEWLYGIVEKKRYSDQVSFRKLLMRLHSTEFYYSIERDQNRAEDGKCLRYRYAISNGYSSSADAIMDILEGPCSVLEMMVALSITCEENIMDDPNVGDRTAQWFWGMIVNLGLGSMSNDRFDRRYVDSVITRFLDRDYDPDGKGGLFRIKQCDRDLRTVEIWHQLCWYINSIT